MKESVPFGGGDDESCWGTEEGAGFEGGREVDELEDVEGEERVDLDGLVSEEGDDVGWLDHWMKARGRIHKGETTTRELSLSLSIFSFDEQRQRRGKLTDRFRETIPLNRPSHGISFPVQKHSHPSSFRARTTRREELVHLNDGDARFGNEVGLDLRDRHDGRERRIGDGDEGVGFEIGYAHGWRVVASEQGRGRERDFLVGEATDEGRFQFRVSLEFVSSEKKSYERTYGKITLTLNSLDPNR